MKKTLVSASLVLGVLMTASCTSETQVTEGSDAKIVVDLGTDMSFSSGTRSALTRAIDESKYTDIKNYTVTLTKTATNEVVHSAIYSEWALAYQVEPGTKYTLSAQYGEDVPASYDKLLVSGSETFTVQAGATKNVDFQCKPKAAKVNVVYDDEFTKYYGDCEVSIKTKYMDSAEKMSKASVGKDLFLKADAEGEDVQLTFDLKDKNGKSIQVDGMATSKSVKVKPQTLLKLTFKPNVTEIEGGKFGLTIKVDTDLTDEDVNITLPSAVFD